MPRTTYVIQDEDGRYYRSHISSFLTIAHSKVLVIPTDHFAQARKFHSLRRATRRARLLSCNSRRYYYVFEIIGSGSEPQLQVRNKDVIDGIKDKDDEMMAKVERIIAKRKEEHERGRD